MKRKERQDLTEELLLRYGEYDADEAKEAAKEAVDEGEPVLEALCFHVLTMSVLSPIHTTSWVKVRAKQDEDGVIKRLVASGASTKDLAIFARMMQMEFLSNFGCILDGAGISDIPDLPFQDFRVFAIDSETGKPTVSIEEMHETMAWSGVESEMKRSKDCATRQE